MIHALTDEYPFIPVIMKHKNKLSSMNLLANVGCAILPIGKDVGRLGWLINKPGGVNEDFDQSQSACDGQLRLWADVFSARASQCR
jgi:hypothetical protein